MAGSAEQVRWLAIAGERNGAGGEQDYTVAADTGSGSVRYIAVAVARGTDGSEVLARYPAFVGGPTPGRAAGSTARAYRPSPIRGRRGARPGAAQLRRLPPSRTSRRTSRPARSSTRSRPASRSATSQRLAVEALGTVLATVIAGDAGGDAYTLAYEVSVEELGGRWEITRIEP